MASKQKAKVTRQIARAKSDRPVMGKNSGIFSNSGVGQKVDNVRGADAVGSREGTTAAYSKTVGAHSALRASILAGVRKTVLLNDSPPKASSKSADTKGL